MRNLHGPRRASALRTIGELEDRGCDAAGYRLAGAGLDHICCRHLYGDDRLLTLAGRRERHVVLVAPHDGSPSDVYGQLLEALGIDMPADEREKASCCDEAGEPTANVDLADAAADSVEQGARRQRRRR